MKSSFQCVSHSRSVRTWFRNSAWTDRGVWNYDLKPVRFRMVQGRILFLADSEKFSGTFLERSCSLGIFFFASFFFFVTFSLSPDRLGHAERSQNHGRNRQISTTSAPIARPCSKSDQWAQITHEWRDKSHLYWDHDKQLY